MSTPDTPKDLTQTDDYRRWKADEERRLSGKSAKHAGLEWEDVLKIAKENLPEAAPPLPYAMTEEGKRLELFRAICPAEFMAKVNRSLLKNPEAFDQVAAWEGMFKGKLAYGATGCGKSRACWSALGRLFVKQNRTFAWFPVKRLMTEYDRYESKGAADEFWYAYAKFDVLFVDDIDKINWSFDSQTAALFAFYDWVYRSHRAVLSTTNKDRAWWSDKLGDAFARRLFEDALTEVKF